MKESIENFKQRPNITSNVINKQEPFSTVDKELLMSLTKLL